MATWARGIDFKNTNNTKRIGGVGVYGTDTNAEKLYIGMGSEPWNNTGLQLTSSSINFKGNKIYHAGDKPTASEIGAAASNHNHNGIYVNDKASVSGNMNNAAGYRNALGMINLSGTDATINPNGQTGWHHFINMSYSESSGSNMWQTQIANKAGTTDLWVRSRAGSAITDGTAWAAPWTRILTGSNYKSVVTPANIGAATSSHTHSYLPLSGGTLTGRLTANGKITMSTSGSSWITGKTLTNAAIGISTQQTTSAYFPVLAVKTSSGHVANIGGLGDEFGFYGYKSDRTDNGTDAHLTFNPSTGAIKASGTITASGGFSGSLSGNATTATTLQTARTINGTSFNGSANITTSKWGTARTLTLTGGATGSVSIDGSANVSLATTVNWSNISGKPTSLPANGGNADTVDNLHATAFARAHSSGHSFGGNQNAITTAQFISLLSAQGAFSQPVWISRGSWSYASNQYINDTGCGNIHLAGCTIEVIGNSTNYTIRIHTPTTSSSGVTNGDFIYVNNGTDYSPGWRRIYNNKYKPTAADVGALTQSTADGRYMRQANANGYYGMTANGDTSNWVRTTNSGIIPYQSGGASSLGTSSWPFNNIYANNIYDNGTLLEDKFLGKTATAAAATKLATARTINGTSFDGTANITTANWGTARNIQIGNTAKSVNGSANVTWSLSEIGAAASNHTHGLVNLNSEAFGGGNDLNTYNSTKTWVARTLNTTTNRPNDYYTVVNFGANSNSNFQLAHSYGNNSILYVRGRHDTSGNYTPWAKVYTDKNKPTAADVGAAPASHTHSYLPLTGGTLTGALTLSGNGKAAVLGTGKNDIYMNNNKSGKYLQLKDDGTLAYSDSVIYHAGRKPSSGELGFGSIPTHAPLITNLNSQLQSGWYSINPSTSGRPSGVDYGVVLQMRWYNGQDFYQILLSSDRARIYTRGYINGGYTGWSER